MTIPRCVFGSNTVKLRMRDRLYQTNGCLAVIRKLLCMSHSAKDCRTLVGAYALTPSQQQFYGYQKRKEFYASMVFYRPGLFVVEARIKTFNAERSSKRKLSSLQHCRDYSSEIC